MSCVCAYTDPGSVYPVIDPRRIAGPPPFNFGYVFAWDGVVVTVEEDTSLGNCQMLVGLKAGPGVTWEKDVLAWNYCTGGPVSSVTTRDANRGPNFMLVSRSLCSSGANTLLLRKLMTWNQMTGLYTFQPNDLWDFWGGMKVTITWVGDTGGSNVWGPAVPPVAYPIVKFPDGTLVNTAAAPGVVFLVFGGAKFLVDPANTLGLNLALALAQDPAVVNSLPPAPVDGTLLREVNDPRVYVFFGGAKFWIPSPAALTSMGFNFGQVGIVPPGTLGPIPLVPRHGTLLREQTDPRVYLVKEFQGPGLRLCWVTSPGVFNSMCLAWRNVRIVPDGSLAALPKGPDL